mmetsp:Transcript_10105/g.30644  ORF Transcript_10105/g.30644 Transcript_10105/m.30644 type:complete len:230 (+) Transcript_10105:980-1669(+)
MSFWKQEPPKPTDACRNLGPMRGSEPQDREISETSAPVASHNAEIELIDETRWASMALATSLESSEDHRFVVSTRSLGTHFVYTSTMTLHAARPSGVWSEPSSTRGGFSKSGTAVPSARNSGLLRTWNLTPGLAPCSSTARTASDVRTGTVDFSTTILSEVATLAIVRAHSSQFLTLAARPAPMPDVLVGVFTEMKTTSASAMPPSMSVEKTRLPCVFPTSTTSSSPGS